MADAGSAVLAGAVAANPYLAIGGQFAQGLGQAMGSQGGPSNAVGRSEAVFDNSGWNVNFGGGEIDSTSEKTTSTGAGGMGNMTDYVPYFAAAVGAIILWRMSRKKA
jgi:hypothetical protein